MAAVVAVPSTFLAPRTAMAAEPQKEILYCFKFVPEPGLKSSGCALPPEECGEMRRHEVEVPNHRVSECHPRTFVIR
ncbi:MAG: hypothetical protein M3270_06120 [Thermoproteota archaeon]|nr:hypothetical protein [Thermoproteota archaeon]